jgi:uncharacterized RDD family membrane protein YckC
MKMSLSNVINLKPNLRKRILANLLDYGFYFVVIIAYMFYFGHETEDGGMAVEGILALPIVIFWVLYFVIIEGIYGGTIGHLGFNLKVMTVDGKDVRIGNSLRRHLLDFIEIGSFGIPAIIAIKNSDKYQRLGDMWANTIVVNLEEE